MSVTEKQLEANRLNAQKSTGPTTEEGRNRSKVNACRHGLTGQIVLMNEDDRAAFDQLVTRMIADLKPVGEVESQLAQSIAHDQWRLNRAAAIEESLYARSLEDADLADAFTKEAKNLQLLTIYEQRINRNKQKNLASLKALQKERIDKWNEDMDEATLLLQDSEIRKIPYDPAKDGFVFSKAEILAEVDRERRLERAVKTNFRGFKPGKTGADIANEVFAAYDKRMQAA